MELSILRWAAEYLHTPFLDWLMPAITRLGDAGFIWLLFALALLAFRKTRREGVVCLLSLFLMLLIGEGLLKHLFQRARPFTLLPEISLLIPPPSSFSFPSGHTTAAFAGAVSIFLYHKKLGCCALALAALIAFSRLYLTVHYPTDILAGILLGIGCAFLSKWLCDRLWKLPAPPPREERR